MVGGECGVVGRAGRRECGGGRKGYAWHVHVHVGGLL